jgi:hypothetical protein
MPPIVTEAAPGRAGGSPELIFLHTAAVHVQTFDALLRELQPQVRARHLVREDLLAAAQGDDADGQQVKLAVSEAVSEIAAAPGSVVLCTCSTIGGLAEAAAASSGISLIRVDRAMADQAVAMGSNILVAAALESTVAPTEALILESASRAGVTPRIARLLVEDAWPFFQQGDFESYLQCIADALSMAVEFDVVVLAQASMAGAAELCSALSVPVLSSPRLGLEQALSALDASMARPRTV